MEKFFNKSYGKTKHALIVLDEHAIRVQCTLPYVNTKQKFMAIKLLE